MDTTDSRAYPLYAYCYYGTNNKFYNNSIWTRDRLEYTYNYIYGYNGTNNEFVNNSLVGSGKYGAGYAYYTSGFSKIDHNNFWNYGDSVLFNWEGVLYTDLISLKSAPGPTGHNLNSKYGDPVYHNPLIGDLYPLTGQLNNQGSLACTGGTVLEDLNKNTRPIHPGDSIDIGCYEFDPTYYTYISGYTWLDRDSNCSLGASDTLFGHLWVTVEDSTGKKYRTFSDSSGFFKIYVADSGVFSFYLDPMPDMIKASCDTIIDTLYTRFDSSVSNILLAQPKWICSKPCINAALRLVGGSATNYNFNVGYKNIGWEDLDSTYITIEYDTVLSVDSATIAYSILSSNKIRVNTGLLKGIRSGRHPLHRFTIYTTADTARGIIGSTICIEARIYPEVSCDPTSAAYDGSVVELGKMMYGDTSIEFIIYNTGADMTDSREATVYEDDIVHSVHPYDIDSADSLVIYIPLPAYAADTGITYTISAPQHKDFPGKSSPILHCELPGYKAGSPWGRAVIRDFPTDDKDCFVDIDCVLLRGVSYDPNSKEVSPQGFTSMNYIDTGIQLEYTIHFQNTGTAAATYVRLSDTISPYLDPSSIISGVSSHEYEFHRYADGLVEWIFDDIYLPDSFTDKEGSKGFVKFTIEQVPGLGPGTRIENQVAIVFDSNAPVLTNIPFVTIGEDWFDTLSTSIPEPITINDQYQVQVYPNPMHETLNIRVSSVEDVENIGYRIYDIQGRLMRQGERSGEHIVTINKGTLPNGAYILEIMVNKEAVSIHKLIVE